MTERATRDADRSRRLLAILSLTLISVGCSTTETTTTTRPLARSSDNTLGPLPAVRVSPEETSRSRVVVNLQPLGPIPYDGQTLPIVAPDGRAIATQRGRAPSWEAILALPNAERPLASSVAIFDLTSGEPLAKNGRAQTAGYLLGRSASGDGVLVERPNADKSRDLALLQWDADTIRTLVADGNVNAHATLRYGEVGELAIAFVSSKPGEENARRLVVLDRNRRELLPPDGASFAFPIYAKDASLLYAFLLTPDSVDFVCCKDNGRSLEIISATTLSNDPATPLFAFQAAMPVQTPSAADGPTIFHPRARSMTLFDANGPARNWTTGGGIPFGFAPSTDGGFVGTPNELVFIPRTGGSGGGRGTGASVVAGTWMPRAVEPFGDEYLLLGAPESGAAFFLSAARLRVNVPADPR